MKKFYLTLFLFTSLFSSSLFASEDIKVGAFVDTQFQLTNSRSTTPGFVLNDAAVYFSHQTETVEFMVDLPFRGAFYDYALDTTSTPNSLTTSSTSNNNFRFASEKAQAYVAYYYNALKITAGQFDTIFGYELNDTNDIFFTEQGLVFNNALPVTHLGLLLTYSFMPMLEAKFLVSNPDGQGELNNKDPEFGIQIAGSSDLLRYAAGFLVNTDGADTNRLLDIVLGKTFFDKLDIDFEFDYNKKDSVPDKGYSFMLHNVYNICDTLAVGIRGEYLYKLVNYQDIQVTAGIAKKITDNFKMKLDYSAKQSKLTNGASYDRTQGVNLAALYSL